MHLNVVYRFVSSSWMIPWTSTAIKKLLLYSCSKAPCHLMTVRVKGPCYTNKVISSSPEPGWRPGCCHCNYHRLHTTADNSVRLNSHICSVYTNEMSTTMSALSKVQPPFTKCTHSFFASSWKELHDVQANPLEESYMIYILSRNLDKNTFSEEVRTLYVYRLNHIGTMSSWRSMY